MRFLNLIFLSFFLIVMNGLAVSTYTTGVTNVATVTITNSQHNLGGVAIAPHVYDTNGVRILDFTYSVNPADYSISFTFNGTFSGTIKLSGTFHPSDVTNAEKDFDASFTASGVEFCSTCSATNFALAGASGKKYYSGGKISYVPASGVASNALVYLDGPKLIVQVGSAAQAGTCSGQCEVRVASGGFPPGVEKLHEITFRTDGTRSRIEKRAWLQ